MILIVKFDEKSLLFTLHEWSINLHHFYSDTGITKVSDFVGTFQNEEFEGDKYDFILIWKKTSVFGLSNL